MKRLLHLRMVPSTCIYHLFKCCLISSFSVPPDITNQGIVEIGAIPVVVHKTRWTWRMPVFQSASLCSRPVDCKNNNLRKPHTTSCHGCTYRAYVGMLIVYDVIYGGHNDSIIYTHAGWSQRRRTISE